MENTQNIHCYSYWNNFQLRRMEAENRLVILDIDTTYIFFAKQNRAAHAAAKCIRFVVVFSYMYTMEWLLLQSCAVFFVFAGILATGPWFRSAEHIWRYRQKQKKLRADEVELANESNEISRKNSFQNGRNRAHCGLTQIIFENAKHTILGNLFRWRWRWSKEPRHQQKKASFMWTMVQA